MLVALKRDRSMTESTDIIKQLERDFGLRRSRIYELMSDGYKRAYGYIWASVFLSNVIIKCSYITLSYNVIMPRKKGDDELRRKALELRSKGLSYREIGNQLGRSSYKVWELVLTYSKKNVNIMCVE
ncbi:MAG: hypothetical protein ABSB40_04620 [Nitrososphaeria archaeon]|jgi:hypothetical protein